MLKLYRSDVSRSGSDAVPMSLVREFVDETSAGQEAPFLLPD